MVTVGHLGAMPVISLAQSVLTHVDGSGKGDST